MPKHDIPTHNTGPTPEEFEAAIAKVLGGTSKAQDFLASTERAMDAAEGTVKSQFQEAREQVWPGEHLRFQTTMVDFLKKTTDPQIAVLALTGALAEILASTTRQGSDEDGNDHFEDQIASTVETLVTVTAEFKDVYATQNLIQGDGNPVRPVGAQ